MTGEDKNYLSDDFVCDWKGWKKVYIPLEMFQFNLRDKKPTFGQKFIISFGVVSRRPMKGKVVIRNIGLAELKK